MKELLHDDDIREEARSEGMEIGRNEGMEIGVKIGEQNRDKSLIEIWLQKGKSISTIAEDLGRTEEDVRKLAGV